MSEISRLFVTVAVRTDEFMRGIDGVTRKMTTVGQSMTRIGGQLTRSITLPIVGVGVAAINTAMQFEYSMAKIEALVGIGRDQLNEWEDDIKDLSKEFGIMPIALAESLYYITSAGLRGAEVMEVLRISAKGMASGLGDAKVIADVLTSVINAYGSENITAARAADILTAAIRAGKVEAPEFTAAIGQVIPIASNMGVEFEQVAAAIAAMTQTGTDAGTASMQLKNILMGLAKPSKQAEDALNDMGTSAAELRDHIEEEGLLSALLKLKDLTGEYGEELMAQVFPNIRSFLGILDLLGENLEDNIQTFEDVVNSTGILNAAWETMSDTAQTEWNKMKASVAVGLQELGDALLPHVSERVGELTDLILEQAEAFAELSEAEQNAILQKIGYAAVAGPVISILGNLTIVTAGLITLFKGPAGWIVLLGVAANAIAEYRDRTLEAWGVSENWRDVIRLTFSPVSNITWAIGQLNDRIEEHGSLTEALVAPWRNLINTIIEAINKAREYFGMSPIGTIPSPPSGASAGFGTRLPNYRDVPYGFHSGGTFRAPRLGGEGLAVLKDGERVIPSGASEHESRPSVINLTANYTVTDKATAEFANNDLVRKLQGRGLAGAFR